MLRGAGDGYVDLMRQRLDGRLPELGKCADQTNPDGLTDEDEVLPDAVRH